jgi:DoxX-like family
MKSKITNTLYWVFTILFAALMIFSAVGGIQPSDDTIKMLHDGLGYPVYFIQFISIAKILGAVAILIPGLKRIKEWAYAGLFFDLAGAVYSGIAAAKGVDPKMLFMLAWVVPGILSYYYWTKKSNA